MRWSLQQRMLLRAGGDAEDPRCPAWLAAGLSDRLDAPVKPRFKMKAPAKIVPRESPALADAAAQFFAIQNQVRVFLRNYADIDLAGVCFPNPFIRGVRFSLATGLHVIAAHDRRHVWQAWNVRKQLPTTTY